MKIERVKKIGKSLQDLCVEKQRIVYIYALISNHLTMKQLILALALTSALFSCKKETTNPTTSNPPTPTNSVVCVDNLSINFTAVGTPVGKFSDCIMDVDRNVYKTVTIGTQTWMAENLKVSKYNDGTTLPNITDDYQWQNNTNGAWAYYNNDTSNNAKYGKLYNWYAVSKTTNGNKNVCPTGWHVPTHSEWTVLSDHLGGETALGKLREVGSTSWYSSNTDATNTSLFSALPGGVRHGFSDYCCIDIVGVWWSSTEGDTGDTWFFSLASNGGGHNNDENKGDGLSVRCIRD
jgi:uncharacterized protein (TIGR02145 family)